MDLDRFRDAMVVELAAQASASLAHKDILVVVHDQLPYVRECLESVIDCTTDYTLYVWDNGSAAETAGYLDGMADRGLITLRRSETNEGFIVPNNRLCDLGQGDYVIPLNSDTRVLPGWSEALVGYLQAHPEVGVVGYQGCRLNERGEGGLIAHGRDVDYVCGWCLCVGRPVVGEIGGLFDERNLVFAYGEDSDLSLRLQEAGRAAHALHLDLVVHHENRTINTVHRELGHFVRETFEHNHAYIRRRWGHRLPRGI